MGQRIDFCVYSRDCRFVSVHRIVRNVALKDKDVFSDYRKF